MIHSKTAPPSGGAVALLVIFAQMDGAVLGLELCDALFDDLLDFFVLGTTFVFGNIAQFVQKNLWNSQGITGEILFHNDAPLTHD